MRYFNPRSREGSDPFDDGRSGHIAISIHAPVKGATLFPRTICAVHMISIHAPVKGATQDRGRFCFCGKNFNPRSREGSDLSKGVDSHPCGHISIHAPVKGATASSVRIRCPRNFNPRSREGSDA